MAGRLWSGECKPNRHCVAGNRWCWSIGTTRSITSTCNHWRIVCWLYRNVASREWTLWVTRANGGSVGVRGSAGTLRGNCSRSIWGADVLRSPAVDVAPVCARWSAPRRCTKNSVVGSNCFIWCDGFSICSHVPDPCAVRKCGLDGSRPGVARAIASSCSRIANDVCACCRNHCSEFSMVWWIYRCGLVAADNWCADGACGRCRTDNSGPHG